MNLSLRTAKIQLELQAVQTRRELTKLQENIRQNGANWSDQSRLKDLQERVIRLQRAQERSQYGRYGLCLACGNPMNPERLELVPDAELCMECHQKHVQTTLRNRRTTTIYSQ